ncbi:MAG: YegP family protein [Firmicutes bacterium]|nr:YegP family protein [Bacillota bacterium]
MGKFEIKEVKTGVKFNLKAGNGQIVATSQIYKSMSGCKNGIASVAKNAAIAAVEDQTEEGFEKQKNPKFEIYTDKAGEFRFRLKAANGQIIASSEGYTKMASCKNGIESVIKNADSPIVFAE